MFPELGNLVVMLHPFCFLDQGRPGKAKRQARILRQWPQLHANPAQLTEGVMASEGEGELNILDGNQDGSEPHSACDID